MAELGLKRRPPNSNHGPPPHPPPHPPAPTQRLADTVSELSPMTHAVSQGKEEQISLKGS